MPPRQARRFLSNPNPNRSTNPQIANAGRIVDLQDVRDRGDYLNHLWDNAVSPTLSSNQTERLMQGRDFGAHGADDERSLTQALAASFFHSVPSPITTMPAQGNNTKTLSEIAGFNDNDIPDHLCCSLSREIMDDPVFDPNHPEYKFERAWIEKRLADKQENPFTRTRLIPANLVSDNLLKTEINFYMEYMQHDTFCGLKPGFLNGKNF